MGARISKWRWAGAFAVGLALAGTLLVLMLSISGHLPERALVSGTAYTQSRTFGHGLWRNEMLAFHELGGPSIFYAKTDSMGHFSLNLPAGTYRVVRQPPQTGDCLVADPTEHCVVQEFSLSAGEHLQVDVTFPQFDQ